VWWRYWTGKLAQKKENIQMILRKRAKLVGPILFVALIVLSACGNSTASIPQSQDDVPRMSAPELKERLDRGEKILVVDARTAGEFQKQHIAGAISVPLNEVASRLDELPRDQDIVFFCT
jgi:hypothetical protein